MTNPINCPGCGAPPGEDHGHECPSTGVYLPEPETPFDHTHSEAASYDEYKTADGKTRITVVTEHGKLKEIDIRVKVEEAGGATKNLKAGNDGLYVQFQCLDIDEVSQLLTALHAAVAGIHKRKDQSNGRAN